MLAHTLRNGMLGSRPCNVKGSQLGDKRLIKAEVDLQGEALNLPTVSGSSSVEWTTFNAPGGNDPLALDMSSMGKGLVWING
ncbi:hypothetical protein Ddye_020584 [Dipteronia dyeriana]|uniref:Beta-galactosidase galactose-binding domain-containing protein n=1 Tax=Dipteronia dyeriana TaxID=168575 RepID=A0AAD9WVI3_9ROSI|nr:hypothetical protein Ddye_020584 [Dipteronia dyeriana]